MSGSPTSAAAANGSNVFHPSSSDLGALKERKAGLLAAKASLQRKLQSSQSTTPASNHGHIGTSKVVIV